MADTATDERHMAAALSLARRGLGETAPNPTVGCVIVKDGVVIGRGRTASGGRPHAETLALAEAGGAALGATAYVTLEPCAHHGNTPPCAQALIRGGISRAVIALRDPDARVNGGGIAMLREAGIAVTEGIGAAEAARINEGFVSVRTRGRPMVTLKLATTLDGRIATHNGESQWITGAEAREAAHALRGSHDAVMVGVGTVLADDPELTCRIDGFRQATLIRAVVDSHLRTPLDGRLARTIGSAPLWLLHRDGVDPARADAFEALGARLFQVTGAEPGIDLAEALSVLAKEGVTRLLVEGGGVLAAALIRADLVDRIAWFTAPSVIGGDGVSAIAGFGLDRLEAAPRFVAEETRKLGRDWLMTLRREACSPES